MNPTHRVPFKIGISGFAGRRSPTLDLVEVDAYDAMERKRHGSGNAVAISAGHGFLRGAPLSKLTDLAEICEAVGARYAVLKLPPSFALWEDAIPLLVRWVVTWKERQSNTDACPLFIDPGKEPDPAFFTEPRLAAHWTADPLWSHTLLSSKLWRIHGWHDARWVRRYSAEQLEQLTRLARKHRPDAIVFAHSQRSIQATEFYEFVSRPAHALNER